MTAEKVLENRLRRVASRRGMTIYKSKRRDPNSIDFGGFMLCDAATTIIIVGGGDFPYSASLEDVRQHLEGNAPKKATRKAKRTTKR